MAADLQFLRVDICVYFRLVIKPFFLLKIAGVHGWMQKVVHLNVCGFYQQVKPRREARWSVSLATFSFSAVLKRNYPYTHPPHVENVKQLTLIVQKSMKVKMYIHHFITTYVKVIVNKLTQHNTDQKTYLVSIKEIRSYYLF